MEDKLSTVVYHLGKFIMGPEVHPHEPVIKLSFVFNNANVVIDFYPSPYWSMDYIELCKSKGWDEPRIYQAIYIAYKEKSSNATQSNLTC